MTAQFLDALNQSEIAFTFVDRRFSATVDDVGRFNLRKVLAGFELANRFNRAIRPDTECVVYFLTNRPASFLADWLVTSAIRRRKTRAIAYIHTVGFESLAKRGRLWNWLVSTTLSSFQTVVILGETLRVDVEPWVTGDRIEIVPNATLGIADQEPEPESESDTGRRRLRVLYLSNFLAEKGPLDFLTIAERLAGGPFEFKMAGAPGEPITTEQIRGRAAKLQADSFELLGKVDSSARDRAMRWADVLVFPSTYRFEAQPLTIVEAMSAGSAVVAYDVGGIRDLVSSGENGWLVSAGDIRELQRCLERLEENRDQLLELQKGALDAFQARHSVSAFRRRWESLIAHRRLS